MQNNKLFALDSPKIICRIFSTIPEIGQCDACSPILFTRNTADRPNTFDEFQFVSPAAINQPVCSTNYTAVIPSGKQAFTLLNKSALNCLNHFSTPHYLKDIPDSWNKVWGKTTVNSTLKEMLNLGLLLPANHVKPELNESQTLLGSWMHITNRCNLNCSYCYLPNNKSDMSKQTGQKAIESIFRSAISHSYKQVKLKYSGGEPLLRFPFITELHKYAQTLAEKHNKELDAVILSNGTLLTPSIIDKIRSLNLRLMISLDGIKEYHDCHRHFPDGSGSFEKVSNAIDLALSKGLIPDISITVTNRNAKGLPQLIEWVLKRNLPFSINFYRESDFSKNHKDLQLEEEKIISGMLAAYKVIESNLPKQSLLASLADRSNLAIPHLRPCSVGHSYMVFDCHGKISKCQMQMNKPVTDIHADDPLTLIRQDQAGILNIKVDEKQECKSCQWKYWCAGGCPLSAFRVSGRYDVKSLNCNIYKRLYPEIIRLEGLRIISSYNLGEM